ncbi:MAG: pyroglutamyl-peptidase I [Planctomycetota bacterium]
MAGRVLITGFEPFGGARTNCTEMVVRTIEAERLTDEITGSFDVRTAILPVTDSEGPAMLERAIKEHAPDGVIALGEAETRTNVSVERVALNLKDYRIPDNAGRTCRDEPIAVEGDDAYFAALPVHTVCEAVQSEGVPCRLSRDAGLFLCNQIMYEVLKRVRVEGVLRYGGFLHLPLVREQSGEKRAVFKSNDSDRGIKMSLDGSEGSVRGPIEPTVPTREMARAVLAAAAVAHLMPA